jgi:hypothetical protein
MDKSKYLMEYVVKDVVGSIVAEQDIDIPAAMVQFYNSAVFEKLQDKETGLYLCSSAYVYDLYLDEKKSGKIVQREI